MRVSDHIRFVRCKEKGIPVTVIEQVVGGEVGIHSREQSPVKRDYRCKCGAVKQEWSNYTPIRVNGKDYFVKVVVCVPCDVAITMFPDERHEGHTPIHEYQWRNGKRQYSGKCYECGKRFTIRSMSLEVCIRETTHKCANGVTRHIMKEQ